MIDLRSDTVQIQSGPGTEVIVEEGCHIFNYEAGGAAMLTGAQLRPLAGVRGALRREQIEAAVRSYDPHFPQTRLVCLENTHNRAGGAVYPIAMMEEVGSFCRERGIRVHLDGARLMNAVAASGLPATRYAAVADTVSLCFSKGLGAPVGTCLAGTADTMERARFARKRLGGGMRQAGLLAAAGLYALHHNVERLAEDHAHARRLAEGLAGMQGLRIDPAGVETNIVRFEMAPDAPPADRLVTALAAEGVLLLTTGARSLRAVTHLDVSGADIETALAAFGRALAAIAAWAPPRAGQPPSPSSSWAFCSFRCRGYPSSWAARRSRMATRACLPSWRSTCPRDGPFPSSPTGRATAWPGSKRARPPWPSASSGCRTRP
jgi:threonine aldolase